MKETDVENLRRANLLHEQEIERLKKETQRESIENKHKEQFYERDKTERQYHNSQEKARTEHDYYRERAHTDHEYQKEKARREEEFQREKHRQETEAMRAKFVMDMIKIIPSLITATIAIIVILDKRKKS